MMKVFFISLAIICSNQLFAQTDSTKFSPEDITYLAAQEYKLKEVGDRIVNSEFYESRRDANHLFIKMLTKALTTPNSFYYSFAHLPFIKIVYAPDYSFRIITWQMEMNGKFYRHYGAIQLNQKDLKLYPLIDRSNDMETPEKVNGNHRKWYGALYYRIIKEKIKKQDIYFVLGYDSNHPLSNKKVIDVLFFENDNAYFGAPFFQNRRNPTQTDSRFILEYKQDASVSLNFDKERGEIVFDHLVPMKDGDEDIYLNYVPDGTFDALVWNGKQFILKENVILTNYSNPQNTNKKQSDTIYKSK